MGKLLVLINGLPGSGKTTVGRSVAAVLGARFLSKDIVKDALASCIDNAVDVPALGGIAMDAVWALARATSSSVVIDSWWFRPRDLDFAADGIATTGANRIVEVWCDVPADVAGSRYRNRHRADYYRDEQHLADDWEVWAEQATPLGLTTVLVVDTTRPVDYADLAHRIDRVTGPTP